MCLAFVRSSFLIRQTRSAAEDGSWEKFNYSEWTGKGHAAHHGVLEVLAQHGMLSWAEAARGGTTFRSEELHVPPKCIRAASAAN